MARTVEDAKLETRAARARLKPRGKPYFRAIGPGLHIGYRKGGTGRWLIRTGSNGSNYIVETFADADDIAPADGVEVLDFKQALVKARELGKAPPGATSFTVGDALDRYLVALTRDGRTAAAIKDARWRADALIRPALGAVDAAALTAEQIRRWRDGLVRARPRLRSRPGEKQKHAERDADSDRSRRATANRSFTVLRAALNHAYQDGKVAHADAWRRVKPFRGVERARIRYLSHAEAGRLLNACDGEFRPLVEAALHTGARYGQLIALTREDFNAAAGTLRLSSRKGDGSEKIHHAVLTAEGAAFFKRLCAGLAHGTAIFAKATGGKWDKSHQSRPMREACGRAKIRPPIGFHGLRHTWASHAVMGGVPLLVVAKNLGHSDTRMTELHYGHLAPSFVADAIRSGAPRFGSPSRDNVASLDDAR